MEVDVKSEKVKSTREGSFNLNDDNWLKHLREHGYAVVKGVVSPSEVKTAKDLLWDWLESLGSGISRNDMRTWSNNNWPGSTFVGFLSTFGGGQSEASWFLRGLPNVKKAFTNLWNTEDLLTSMDTFILWRPWWNALEGEDWTPSVERIHCDQNPVHKPGFHCVQGMIPLLPVTTESGGLQVIPDTNNDEGQNYIKTNYPRAANGFSDWCEFKSNDKYIGTGILLEADPGDLILWDSRTFHGGLVGTGPKNVKDDTPELVRLSLTVCMAPSSKATPRVLDQRRLAVKNGWTLTHWPYEFNRNIGSNTNGSNITKWKYIPPKLSQEQLKLVG